MIIDTFAPRPRRMKSLYKSAAATLLALGLCFNIGSGLAQSVGYQTLEAPLPLRTTSDEAQTAEVLEFFWFGCPHCFAFEPSINAWAAEKPDHVNFVREAPPLNPSWVPHSQAFYAAEILGVTDTLFDALFHAIHVDRMNLRTPETLASFAGTLGIDEQLFKETMQSTAVRERMEDAMQLAIDARITGVPSVLVNGQYLTSNSLAGGHDGIIDVINTLTANPQ